MRAVRPRPLEQTGHMKLWQWSDCVSCKQCSNAGCLHATASGDCRKRLVELYLAPESVGKPPFWALLSSEIPASAAQSPTSMIASAVIHYLEKPAHAKSLGG